MSRQRKSTAIRTARKATNTRKRAAFEFQSPENLGNKKPRQSPGSMLFDVAGKPYEAPAAEPNTPPNEVLSHEFC